MQSTSAEKKGLSIAQNEQKLLVISLSKDMEIKQHTNKYVKRLTN